MQELWRKKQSEVCFYLFVNWLNIFNVLPVADVFRKFQKIGMKNKTPTPLSHYMEKLEIWSILSISSHSFIRLIEKLLVVGSNDFMSEKFWTIFCAFLRLLKNRIIRYNCCGLGTSLTVKKIHITTSISLYKGRNKIS